jgi:hypothetical protein
MNGVDRMRLTVGVLLVAALVAGCSAPPDPARPSPPPVSAAGSAPVSSEPDGLVWPDSWSATTVALPPASADYTPCPTGTVTFAAQGETVFEGVRIALSRPVATGDLTGDGRDEAVAYVHCESRVEVDSGDGSGHLMVISQPGPGTFIGLAHVGVSGENYEAARVQDGTLVATVEQRYGDGVQDRTYRWNGTSFDQIGGPTAFPG